MKKSTFVVVVVLALALCVPAVAFAALSPSSPMAIGSRSAAATCPNYADRNANGACDRHENGACPGYTDADGDGVCDNYQDGACSGYVDADGDGICDNCAGAGANCPGYVDADGDGVCDNYGSGEGPGPGQGCSKRERPGSWPWPSPWRRPRLRSLNKPCECVRSAPDIEETMARHGDTVWRVCLTALCRHADAEDAFQNSFLKYALADDVQFREEEHRKAWLIRVASNTCRDMRRAAAGKNVPLDETSFESLASRDEEAQPDSRVKEVLDAMSDLDDPPRTPVYLALYEGYTAPEIASMLDVPVNTVYSWIARGKKTLKEALS